MGDGETLSRALQALKIKPHQFRKALDEDPTKMEAYSRTKQLRAEMYADEIIDIADQERDAQRARNRIDARKWVAGKILAAVYGDKVSLEVTHRRNPAERRAEALARMERMVERPVCDLTAADAVQVLEHVGALPYVTTDTGSDAPSAHDGMPNVFD